MADTKDLLDKKANETQKNYVEENGIPQDETLSAEEFVEGIVKPLVDLQENAVREIRRGANSYKPVDGVVTFPSDEASVSIVVQESTTSVVFTGDKVLLHIRVVSIEGGSDTGNLVTLAVQRYANGAYATVKTLSIPSSPSSSTAFMELDITDVVVNGDNQIRLEATDVETMKTGRIVFQSIVKATLSVEMINDWSVPIDAENGMELSYAIFGTDVSKMFYLRIYDNQQKNYREIVRNVGTLTYSKAQPYRLEAIVDTPADTVKVMTHGVHTIEAWCECETDGKKSSSPHVKNQVMVVADASNKKAYLMIQQPKGAPVDATLGTYFFTDNYVQNESLFAYAVYNPTATASGTKVTFSVDNATNTINIMKTEQMAQNNKQYVVPATIQVDGIAEGSETFVYLTAQDSSGSSFIVSPDGSRLAILVRNEHNFSPTIGADLYINPSVRNNAEEHPDQILNAAKNNALINATFEGFRFDANDGWIQSNDGKRILRVLAGQKLTIDYDVFSDFRSNPKSNVTVEFDMMVRNVTNEGDPIINISNAVPSSGLYTGIRMNPLEGCIMTTSQTTYGQQNFGWREGVKTHVVVNICSAIYPDPNRDKTIPLVRVFINANPYREFIFDIDENDWGRNPYKIEIGQEDAEIDIYTLRVYKKAVSALDVMQNYISSLPTSEEKVEFNELNNILNADGTISFDKAREKYSCIVHHGTPPSLQKPDSTTCWIEIHHMVNGVYDKDTSGTICAETKTLPVKGQGSTAKKYCDWNQQYDAKKSKGKIVVNGAEVTDGWIDGNGKYKGAFYQLDSNDAKGEKLVGKINYASSMQSHKMGAINAYNDLYRAVMGTSLDTIMSEDSKARCTCKEDMFFFFVQEDGEATPHYEGIMTFGPGKMDKKTWGYSSDKYPDFGMFEGSDNDQPITNFQRPWIDSEVTYNPDEEYYEYNGKGNIDFDEGAVITDENEVEWPTGTAVRVIKDFINFGYLYCTDIEPYIGTASQLIKDGDKLNIHKQYWIVSADSIAARGDLYSWSPLQETWVKAGINKETRNIFSENPSVSFAADYEATNEALIESICARFKAEGGKYYNVRSKLFHSCFVENLIAGSDNCAKNTYYVCDPKKHIICFHADDLDTIFKTDNVGWQTKPYYVDRVHHIDDEGNETFSGTHNFFFNTFDRAYEAEKATMMKDIFTAMASIAGSVQGFFERYFFSIQRSIPCVAYLEQARIRYEKRQVQVNNNEVVLETVNPITQQLGSQLESELQYMERRLVYFQSYAAYGQFAVGGGGNNFGFRGYPKRDGGGARIAFTVKPHQYIYPTAAFGQTLINPHVRLAPNDTYEIEIEKSCSSDTTCSLFGIDYYKEIGNLGELSVNPGYEISIGGARLTKVEAYPTDGGLGEFRPATLTINAKLIDSVRVNVANIGTNLDLRQQTRLKTVDTENSSLTQVRLPSTQTLTTVRLGKKIDTLAVANMPNLGLLTMQKYSNLVTYTIGNNVPMLDTYEILAAAYGEGAGITLLTAENISWNGVSANVLDYICSIKQSDSITGKMVISYNQNIGPALKIKLIEKYGNVDSVGNPLYIDYRKVAISSLVVSSERPVKSAGEYKYTLDIVPATGNAFTNIEWSVTPNPFCTINPKNGVLKVTSVADPNVEQPVVAVKAIVTLSSGSTMEGTLNVRMYNRIPMVGDFAYADGEFDDVLYKKDVVGWVYKVTKYQDLPDYVLEEYLKDGAIKAKHDGGQQLYEVLVQSAKYISIMSSDNKTELSMFAWGIYNGTNTSSISNDELNPISEASLIPINYLRNLESVYNTSNTGLTNNTYDDSVYDDTSKDGFAEFAPTVTAGRFDGKRNTKVIFDQAEKILNGYVGSGIMRDGSNRTIWDFIKVDHIVPQNLTELADLLIGLSTLGGNKRWRQLAYPAAAACYLFEPNGANLDKQYAKGNWYLLAGGDALRIFTYYRNSCALSTSSSGTPSASYSDINNPSRPTEPTEARRPWYANMIKRAQQAGKTCPISNFISDSGNEWSSNETANATDAYRVRPAGSSGQSKYSEFYVRPVVAFCFEQ